MNFESKSSGSGPLDMELHKLSVPADVSISSRVYLPHEDLTSDGENSYGRPILKNARGERFHVITSYPQVQQFASRLLKPFFTTADIVNMDGKWYSHEPLLSSIERRVSAAQVHADCILINVLTRDGDHEPGANNTFIDGKSVFFDFECFLSFFRDNSNAINKLQNFIINEPEVLPYVRDKSEQMLAYWQSRDGKEQILAAFKAAGGDIDEIFSDAHSRTLGDFYNILLYRAKQSLELCQKLESEQTSRQEAA